jgi:muramoyltetrapeptide carboxypeptidase
MIDAATPAFANPVAEEKRLVQRQWRTRTATGGKAQGVLLGGNLTVLTALMGTPYLPDFTGAILVIEDVDEAEYRIDRMLTQLALGGVLGKVAGVVFGQCTDCIDEGPGMGNFPLGVVLDQHLKPLGVPAFHGAAFGHIADQYILPLGTRAEIDADAGTIRILEPAVI